MVDGPHGGPTPSLTNPDLGTWPAMANNTHVDVSSIWIGTGWTLSTTPGLTPTQHNLARHSSSIRHDWAATHRDGVPLPNPNSVPDSTQDSRSATIRFR